MQPNGIEHSLVDTAHGIRYQRNARRHRAFIFGEVHLIFERLHVIPKVLNVDFVTANLQLSITAKKSDLKNKHSVYILNVPRKLHTSRDKKAVDGQAFHQIVVSAIEICHFPPP